MQNSIYIFFKCLYQLELCQLKIGYVREINYFLYRWFKNVDKNKNTQRKKASSSFPT